MSFGGGCWSDLKQPAPSDMLYWGWAFWALGFALTADKEKSGNG